ncbi:MAG: hypothetical protein ACKVPJ_02415 [Chitinophagales bacterium]
MITKQQQIYNLLHDGQPKKDEDAELHSLFVSFLKRKYDTYLIEKEVETTSLKSNALTFLLEDDDFYSHQDLK